jgi:group I intron endonuclease
MQASDLRAAKEFAINFGVKTSGIYAIIINKKWYVGSAINFKSRRHTHKKKLNTNKHPNNHLQLAFNKYQEFEFRVLERCEPEKLLEREEWWIEWTDCCNPEKGYNKRRKPNSNLGLKFSEEIRAKISASNLGKHSSPKPPLTLEQRLNLSNALKGKSKSEVHKKAMSLARKGEVRTDEQKLKISKSLKGNSNALGHKVSEKMKIDLAEKLRDKDKWPHEKGCHCKCEECKQKRSKSSLEG